jgi:hypothetical protein
MLSAFFRSEVPSPWPKAPTPARNQTVLAPAPATDDPRRVWVSSPSFTMAAAVALLLAGYAWLAGQFPQPQNAMPPGPREPMTGKLEGVVPLPNGGEARFQEERLRNGGFRFHIEESKRPSPPR